MIRLPPLPPLFPYTTLFRSHGHERFIRSRARQPAGAAQFSDECRRDDAGNAWGAQGRMAQNVSGDRAQVVTSSGEDRKSTRLNSSHLVISYAVFCLKKKKNR